MLSHLLVLAAGPAPGNAPGQGHGPHVNTGIVVLVIVVVLLAAGGLLFLLNRSRGQ